MQNFSLMNLPQILLSLRIILDNAGDWMLVEVMLPLKIDYLNEIEQLVLAIGARSTDDSAKIQERSVPTDRAERKEKEKINKEKKVKKNAFRPGFRFSSVVRPHSAKSENRSLSYIRMPVQRVFK